MILPVLYGYDMDDFLGREQRLEC